jgi:hypothetical protein
MLILDIMKIFNTKHISLPKNLHSFILEEIEKDEVTNFKVLDVTYNDMSTLFDCWKLKKNCEIKKRIIEEFAIPNGLEFEELRIHRFQPDFFTNRHIDNYLPDNDTLIICLQGNENRLLINDKIVTEKSGKGYLLPEGTPHEVLTGHSVRYSLTGWCHSI